MVAPKPEIQKVEPQKIEEPNSKRGMPAKALAKYLASKHPLTAKAPAPKAAPPVEVSKTAPVPIKTSAPSPVAEAPAKVEAPTKTEVPTKAEVPAPIPAPVAKAPVAEPQTPVAPKVAERSKDSKIPGGDDSKAGLAVEESGMSEKAEKETPVVTKIVEAPSAKMNKKAPEKKPSLSEDEKIIEAPKEAQTAKPQKSLAKRKIPGSIEFKMNDPSIQGDAMTNLDQTGKFLLENPSTTLILQGVSSSGEISNIIDSRYESIRSYLTAKGVPDDQIRLDPERKNGKAPQFELYLIEH
jgi:outer membrane protein OmpA-like peptidoglycan-associated protein